MPKKIKKPDWDSKKTNKLFQAILKLKNTEECRRFFRDLSTLEEMQNMSERWEAVLLLNEGKLSYRDISKKTGLSTTTIGRISWWMRYGEGGYDLALKRLKLKK